MFESGEYAVAKKDIVLGDNFIAEKGEVGFVEHRFKERENNVEEEYVDIKFHYQTITVPICLTKNLFDSLEEAEKTELLLPLLELDEEQKWLKKLLDYQGSSTLPKPPENVYEHLKNRMEHQIPSEMYNYAIAESRKKHLLRFLQTEEEKR